MGQSIVHVVVSPGLELAALLAGGTVAGGLLFASADLAYTIAVESFVMPRMGPMTPDLPRSIIAFFLVVLLGGPTGGILFAVARFPNGWPAIGIPLLAAALLGWFARSWWRESRVQHGFDPSDLLDFVPMLGASGLVVVLSAVVWLSRVWPCLRSCSEWA